MSNSNSNLLLSACLVLLIVATVTATDHIVGANKGWNPSINYTRWSNNQTFYVGDFISFRYQKTQYNVFLVNETGYDNCTTDGALGNWSSGKDFILLNDSQRYYFICGNGQCFNGMKVSIMVHPLPSSPTSSPAAGSHTSSNSSNAAGQVLLPKGVAGLRVLVVALASIWFGSGWI